MSDIDSQLHGCLTLLRNKIRDQGFTQQEVQETLGWGRSYISQILTKQKSLRLEQVLKILDVIEVEPIGFWSELYLAGTDAAKPRQGPKRAPWQWPDRGNQELRLDIRECRTLFRALMVALVDEGVITSEDLGRALGTLGEHGLGEIGVNWPGGEGEPAP